MAEDYNLRGVEEYERSLDRPPGEPLTTTTGTWGVASGLQGLLQNLGHAYEGNIARPVTDALKAGLEYTYPYAENPDAARQTMESVAEWVVPQNLVELGLDVGLGAVGRGASLGRAIGRPVAGALSGAILQGANPPELFRAAEHGAGAGLVNYGLGGLLNMARRGGYLPGGGSQQVADEAAVGRAIGEISPTLGPTPTAVAMQERLKGRSGQDALSAAYASDRAAVETVFGGQGLTAPPGSALEQLTGRTSMSLDTALSAIERLRAGTHTAAGVGKATMGAQEMRALRRQAVEEVEAALGTVDPQLGTMFRNAEQAYGAGSELLRIFRTTGVLDPEVRGLNMAKLQALLGNRAPQTERSLTPNQWAILREAVFRGAKPPAMDAPILGGTAPRLYAGPISETLSRVVPTSYIGTPINVPNLPFALGVGEVSSALWPPPSTPSRNPYQR